jgi:two-component system NarL family response regulator
MNAAGGPGDAISVIIADDHPVTRDGLALILRSESGISVLGQAGDGLEAIECYRACRPDVAILDLQMPRLNGLGATREIIKEFPKARILLFTTYDGDEDIYRAMHSGARGYILKDAAQEDLFKAIRAIHAGQRYLSPPVGAKLAEVHVSRGLTDRERQVLRLLAEGLPNKEISLATGVSESTVKSHVASIIEKLGVKSRTEAALIAEKRGFLRG